jgi:hypothetical protein
LVGTSSTTTTAECIQRWDIARLLPLNAVPRNSISVYETETRSLVSTLSINTAFKQRMRSGRSNKLAPLRRAMGRPPPAAVLRITARPYRTASHALPDKSGIWSQSNGTPYALHREDRQPAFNAFRRGCLT